MMTGPDRELGTLIDGGAFLECPRWHDGRLWVSDFWRERVLAIAPDGTTEVVAEVPAWPGGLGWHPDGTPLVVSMQDNRVVRVRDGGLAPHADLSEHSSGSGNDMVVDAAGGAYVGTVDFAGMATMPATNLLRVDPDGSVRVAAKDLAFPNGMVITPDGTTLVVAESWAARLTAFDIGPDGSLSGRREWAPFAGAPDGLALDAEGAIWVADASGNRAVRVREGGEVLEEIGTGDFGVFACALGGDDGRTLFLCASPTFDRDEAVASPRSRVLTCRVDVPAGPAGTA
ncbi:SMP-30/gluconolactonase/LRE family protein [Streptosporangium sp. NPDC023615]|uniref:SMP-30/gluconolactonase/LRE family protein n=1 Tax=Streptosporangium sp. NPDC023615 TaxID=3154794 RepID=UPI00343A39A5